MFQTIASLSLTSAHANVINFFGGWQQIHKARSGSTDRVRSICSQSSLNLSITCLCWIQFWSWRSFVPWKIGTGGLKSYLVACGPEEIATDCYPFDPCHAQGPTRVVPQICWPRSTHTQTKNDVRSEISVAEKARLVLLNNHEWLVISVKGSNKWVRFMDDLDLVDRNWRTKQDWTILNPIFTVPRPWGRSQCCERCLFAPKTSACHHSCESEFIGSVVSWWLKGYVKARVRFSP